MPETTAAVRSAITWFEIPTADFDRARRFYETIFETSLNEHPFGASRIAIFSYERPGVGGCLAEPFEDEPDKTLGVFLQRVKGSGAGRNA